MLFFSKPTFSIENFPSSRYMVSLHGWARPNPQGNIVACLVPAELGTVAIKAPWGSLDAIGGRHWHQVAAMDNGEGKVNEYPNDKFTEDFRVIQELKRGEDPRGDRLFDLYGDKTRVVLAQKTAPVIVLGKFKKACRFVTSESKKGPLEVGSGAYLVTNLARDRIWVVDGTAFPKLYEDGQVHAGNPPQD